MLSYAIPLIFVLLVLAALLLLADRLEEGRIVGGREGRRATPRQRRRRAARRRQAAGQDAQAAELEKLFARYETTPATSYSTVRGRPAFLRQELAYFDELRRRVAPRTVVDGTAHVGVDTTILARSFPGARITAVERDPPTFERLSRNIAAAGLAGRVSPVNRSVVDWFREGGRADLVYLDPPWGGPDYGETDDLPLADEAGRPAPLPAFVGRVLEAAPRVVLKVPHNFRHGAFADRLGGGRIARLTPIEYGRRRERAAFLLLEIVRDGKRGGHT